LQNGLGLRLRRIKADVTGSEGQKEERSQRGQIDIRPSSGKDDQAVALALSTSEVMNHRPPDIFESVILDRRPLRAELRLEPENCP
jgi:hypothetical protein